MKILHLCDSLNPAGLGGYESYLYYLSKQLSEHEHESIVVTQKPSHTGPNSRVHQYFRVIYLPGNLLEARKWEFYSLPEIEREHEVSRLFHDDDLEVNVQFLIKQLLEVVHEEKPDIIHTHSTYVVFNRVLKNLREKKLLDEIPILATIHGRPKSLILPNGKNTTDYEELLEACPFDLVLGVSKNVTGLLRSAFHERKISTPVKTCYLGIDLTVFTPYENALKKWDLAFMGRLERMKAVDLFPEMVVKLKQHFPNLKFLITGEGSLKEDLLMEFKRKGVANLVDYQGVVKADIVPELINRSSIFIYPSREEPFGLSILEAMACEVPVVTTSVFGPSEILTQNVDGVMVPPDDVNALVEKIRLLLQDENLRMIMGRNARKTVESRFNITKHSNELTSLYKRLIGLKKSESVGG